MSLIIMLTLACGSFGTKTEMDNTAVDHKTENKTAEKPKNPRATMRKKKNLRAI